MNWQMVSGRSALQMAEQFMSERGSASQAAALWGARALRRLRAAAGGAALAHATALRYADVSIAGCAEVLDALRSGDFGACEAELAAYVAACRARFPYARAFQPAPAPEPEPDTAPDTAPEPEPADN